MKLNHFSLPRYVLLVGVAAMLMSLRSNAQERRDLIKVGIFLYPYEWTTYNGFSAHIEYEMPLGRSKVFSSGPRVEYIDPKAANPSITLGYELKFYPLAGLMKRQLEGPFLGLDALYLVANTTRARYGPGIGFMAGYQHQLKNGMALSFEASPIYMTDLNEKSIQTNVGHRYWYAFASVKIGFPN